MRFRLILDRPLRTAISSKMEYRSPPTLFGGVQTVNARYGNFHSRAALQNR
jgi:hypothetical protein